MEDVRTVDMDGHAVTIFAVEVTPDMVATVNDLDTLSCLYGTPSHDGAEEPRTDNKVVVWLTLVAQHSLGMKSSVQGAPADGGSCACHTSD